MTLIAILSYPIGTIPSPYLFSCPSNGPPLIYIVYLYFQDHSASVHSESQWPNVLDCCVSQRACCRYRVPKEYSPGSIGPHCMGYGRSWVFVHLNWRNLLWTTYNIMTIQSKFVSLFQDETVVPVLIMVATFEEKGLQNGMSPWSFWVLASSFSRPRISFFTPTEVK